MDWNLIIYSALGGGLGAIIGSFLSKAFGASKSHESPKANSEENPKKNRTLLTVIFVIAGLNILPFLYRSGTLPQFIPLNMEALHKELPVLAEIQREDLESYERMIEPLKSSARRGTPNQQELDSFRKVYHEVIAEKSKFASETTLKGMQELSIEQFEILKQKAPRICTLVANNLPYPTLEEYLGKDFAKREQTALMKLFSEKPRDPAFVADLDNGEKIFNDFAVKIIGELLITSLNPDTSPQIENLDEHEKVCDFSIAYSTLMMSLDTKEFYDVDAFMATQQ